MTDALNSSIEDGKPEVATTAIAEYSQIAAALALLSDKYKGAVFEVTTKQGLVTAKAARAELRGYRTNLEAVRKNIKGPALERCRLIDAEAKEITASLSALEDPIAAQIKIEEDRIEAEREAKLQADIRRVEGIRARIGEIISRAETVEGSSAACEVALAKLGEIKIGPDFEEFQEEAQRAVESTAFRLGNLAEQYRKAEADRAELERLRQADEDRRRNEAATKAREELERRARIEAEDKVRREAQAKEDAERREKQRQEDADRALAQRLLDEQAARVRAEQEAIDKAKREAEQAEQRRLDAIAAERKRVEDEEKARERAEQENAEAAARRLRNAAPAMLSALLVAKKAITGVLEEEPENEGMAQAFDQLKAVLPSIESALIAAEYLPNGQYYALQSDGHKMLCNADGSRSVFDDVDE